METIVKKIRCYAIIIEDNKIALVKKLGEVIKVNMIYLVVEWTIEKYQQKHYIVNVCKKLGAK